MATITWRELVGPADNGAFRALGAAGETLNGGFDALGKVITQRQAAAQVQADTGREANVAAYLDRVQQANTPEALAALQGSGELDALRGKVDPRDLARIRGADETRLSSVRKNTVDAQAFTDAQTIWENRDLVNQAQALFAVGKGQEAAALLEPIKHILPTYGEAIAKGTALVDARTKLESDLKGAKITQAATASNAAANTQNAITNAGQLDVHRQQVAQTGLQNLEAQRAAIGQKLAAANQGTFGSEEGQKAYEQAIKVGAGDKAPTVMRLAGEAMAQNPKFRALPTDVVAQIVLAHSSDIGTGKWMPDLNVSSRIAADLEKAMGNKDIQAQMLRVETSRANLASQLQGLSGMSQEAMQSAYPGFASRVDAALAARQAAAPAPTAEPQRAAPAGANASAAAATPAAPAPAAVADFKLDPKMEQLAEKQQTEMGLGARTLYTPEVAKYLKDKDAAIAALNKPSTPNGQREDLAKELAQARAKASGNYGTLFDAAARRAAEDPAKKAK
jgi:hypothetical protein